MSRSARVLISVVLLTAVGVLAGLSRWSHAGEPAKGPPGKEAAKGPPGGIKVSRETTFITAPLRKDGTVDYLTAIDQRYSQGVTPENNAAVLLLQAFGPADVLEPFRERLFQRLGMAPLPEKGPYLEEFTAYFKRKSPGPPGRREWQEPDVSQMAYDELRRIMDRPWSKKDSPIAAAWLQENDKPLDLVVAATKRPRFYVPPMASRDEPGMVIAVLLPNVQNSRDAAHALGARAMFRIGAGKCDEAWQDLLACHRLARLVDQGPTLVEGLVAVAIEGIAIQGNAVLAHEGKLTPEQARRFAAEFRKLPPLAKMVDRINWAERLVYLDCVLVASRKGIGQIGGLTGSSLGREGRFVSFAQRVVTFLVDWNEPMRMGNQWYDRLVAALSKPSRKERDAAVAEFERDLKKVAADAKDPRVLLANIASADSLRGGLGRQVGNVCIALFMPALSACTNAEDRCTASESMVPVVFALAAYRADHGSYPADLAALVPKYLPAIPVDLFSGGPVRYKREDKGYVVYSVGINRKDDGGRAFEGPDTEGCDDYAIRVPGKRK